MLKVILSKHKAMLTRIVGFFGIHWSMASIKVRSENSRVASIFNQQKLLQLGNSIRIKVTIMS